MLKITREEVFKYWNCLYSSEDEWEEKFFNLNPNISYGVEIIERNNMGKMIVIVTKNENGGGGGLEFVGDDLEKILEDHYYDKFMDRLQKFTKKDNK